MKTFVSVVSPVYLGEPCLVELHERLKSTLTKLGVDFEIIFVDDHSPDDSFRIIKELNSKDARVKGFRFSRNFGQHYAITAGLDQSKGDWVVVMDCDLQDKPEEIAKLYLKAQEGYDIVLAKRENRKDGFLKKMSSNLFYLVFNFLTGVKHDKDTAGFSIISRKAVNSLVELREHKRYFPSLIQWIGFNKTTVYVEHGHSSRSSSYTLSKLIDLSIDAFVSYSNKPLYYVIKLGATISFFAFLYGGYIYYIALNNQTTVAGWASVIVSLYFLSGLILANMGIVGVYVGRLLDESKRRPLYIIADAVPQNQNINKR